MLLDELRDLRYFLEVARCLSFSTAAVRLSVSPGAVSKAVARLEQHMKATLFVRASRALRLSPEGRQLYDRLDSAYAQLEHAWDDARQSSDVITGTVHVSTFMVFGRTRLAPLLEKFVAAYPGIELVISMHDTWRGVSRERFDLQITWGEKLESEKVAHSLGKLPLIMVASPGYLDKHGTPLTPANLSGHECLGGVGPAGSKLRWVFVPHDAEEEKDREPFVFVPRGSIAVMDEMGAVADFARHGLGVTVVDPVDVRDDLGSGKLIRLMSDYRITINSPECAEIILQYRPRHKLSGAAACLVDFLIENSMEGPDEPAAQTS